MKFIFLFFLLILSLSVTSCDNNTSESDIDNCKGNPCASSPIPHKTVCKVTESSFTCICEDGYELNGSLCKEKTIDLCKDKQCDEHSSCKVINNSAQCVCDSGYTRGENKCEEIKDNNLHRIWTDNNYTENSGITLTTDNENNIVIAGYTSSKLIFNDELQKEVPTEADTTVRKYSANGELLWEKVWHNEIYDNPVAIVTDKNNNIFIAGEKGSDDFRVFLIKISPDGNKIWTKEWGCENGLLVWDMDMDNEGNMYITGRTYSHFNNTTSKGGISDSFLIKVKDNGASASELWIKQWGTDKMDEGKAIIIKNDNIFVLTENNGDSDIPDDQGSIKWDFNITKFDKNGNIVSDNNWIKGLIDTYVVDFLIDDDNNFYIVGDSPKNFDGHVNNGDNDIFIIKLDSNFSKKWSKLIGSEYYDTINSITIDKNHNIFLGGHSFGSMGGWTNPGEGVESDALLIKMTNDEITEYKMFSSVNRLAGDSIMKVITDNHDNLLLTGVENADYIGDTQNLKSSGYLIRLTDF